MDRHGGYNLDEKKRFGFSSNGHGMDRMVTKIEKSVHTIIEHRQRKEQEDTQEDLTRPKHSLMKIPKWKQHYDSVNKASNKVNNEPPSMIVEGGWVRPNRAMWASPPGTGTTSRELPQKNIGEALEYLREVGPKTYNSSTFRFK